MSDWDDFDDMLWDLVEMGWGWFALFVFVVLVFIIGFFVGTHSMSRRLSDDVEAQARETRACQQGLSEEKEMHEEWRRIAREDYQRLEKECNIR